MARIPDFASRDPLSPRFWDERFEQAFTPWERGRASAAVQRFVALSERPLSVLIPGCGSAHELALMCEAGWDATAIDFSPVAVARARAQAGPWAERIVQADFFDYAPARTLDLVYEQAFLCALPRARWAEVAQRWMTLVRPGGMLAGYFFFDGAEKGPPFGIARTRLDELLLPGFECVVDEAVEDSIPVFAGKERWMVWRRKNVVPAQAGTQVRGGSKNLDSRLRGNDGLESKVVVSAVPGDGQKERPAKAGPDLSILLRYCGDGKPTAQTSVS